MDKNREMKLAISFIQGVSAEDLARIWKTDILWESIEIFLGKDGMEKFTKELDWLNDSSLGEHGHVFYDEEDYPQSLKSDPYAPYRIAYIGSKPKGTNGTFNKAESVTVIGTRRCTSEGIKEAFVFASEAANAGLIVYSGYADGIDKAAHFGAVATKSPTFAVLPSGLSHSYAHRNVRLEEYILGNGGGLLSQFKYDAEPYKSNFYIRNRMLASITDATVVIEAPEHSGSLITAHAAAERGKGVYVCSPFLKNSPTTDGIHLLKSEGAIEVSSYSSLSDRFNEFPKGPLTLEVRKDKCAEMKVGARMDKTVVVGYNGSYFSFLSTH